MGLLTNTDRCKPPVVPDWLKPYAPSQTHMDVIGMQWVRCKESTRDEIVTRILLMYPEFKLQPMNSEGVLGIYNTDGNLILWGKDRVLLDLKLL